MRLQDIAVQGVEDSAEGSNGMQINDKRKSFLVYCESAQEKVYWLKTLKRFIKLSRTCPDFGLELAFLSFLQRMRAEHRFRVRSSVCDGCTLILALILWGLGGSAALQSYGLCSRVSRRVRGDGRRQRPGRLSGSVGA